MVRRAAVFPAAFSVGVACSPRVGVPSIPRVVSGGWWVCAGVIRTASDACFGGVCWGGRPWESWGVRWGWGGAGPPGVVCPSWALLHALRTRQSMDTAKYLNQTRPRYPGGVTELDAALHLLHPMDMGVEVGEVPIFVQGAGKTPSHPRPTNPV